MTAFDPSMLPPRPTFITPELIAAAQRQGFTPSPAGPLDKIGIVGMFLENMKNAFAGPFGLDVTLTSEGMRWTLTVEMPEPEPVGDDIEVRAQVVE